MFHVIRRNEQRHGSSEDHHVQRGKKGDRLQHFFAQRRKKEEAAARIVLGTSKKLFKGKIEKLSSTISGKEEEHLTPALNEGNVPL